MPRTVVYDSPTTQLHLARELDAAGGRVSLMKLGTLRTNAFMRAQAGEAPESTTWEAVQAPPQDDYASKVAKYVPVEVTAVSIAGFQAFNPTDHGWVWAALATGGAANVLYLFAAAAVLPRTARPRAYFYLLASFGYVFWALALIPEARQILWLGGADGLEKATYLLTAAAFGLPLIDTALSRLEIRLRGA